MLQYSGQTPNAALSKPSKDTGNEIPADILRVFQNLPENDNVIRFFSRTSDTFETFDTFSTEAVNNLQGRPTKPGDCLCLSPPQFRSCLRDLFSGHQRNSVEIWEFSTVKKAWRLAKSASPANTEQVEEYFTASGNDENGEFSSSVAPVVVAIINNATIGMVGLAAADAVSFTLTLSQFTDNDLLSNVEIALIQLGAVECIIPETGGDVFYKKLQEICSNCNIALTCLKSSEFTSNLDTIEVDLLKLVKDDNFASLEKSPTVLKAACGIVNYLKLMRSDSNLKAFKFTPYDLSAYMKLDDTALRSLHLFPSSTGPKHTSLYGLLNECKTVQGSRLLEQWIRQPLLSKEMIENRLDVVEAFFDCSSVRQGLREVVLRAMPDLARIIKRLVRGSCNLQDIVVLYQAIAKIPPILEELGNADEKHKGILSARYVAPLEALLTSLKPFAEMVEKMVDFTALERHEYIVRADFDEGLQEIAQQKDAILEAIEPEFLEAAKDLGLEANKKIKLERNNIHGYYLRVSRIDANLIKGGQYQELAALKNGVYFVTPHLRELSIRYDELCRLYASKQSVLVKEMLEVTASFRPLFDQYNLVIADLDVAMSLAYVSLMSSKSFVRPQIGGPDLVLRGARHPCLEANQSDFIPNDVEFKRDASCMQIITGPNMGGKSTYIRQAALCIIMAQIGCFVPADVAEVPVFDAVMVRVGAGDNILRGISTFMAEMLETASILRTATRDTFVVIDELGRGTSTSEGLGLAWGVAKYLATKIGCFAFFATHFHELTVLADELPALIKNLHVSAQIHDGRLTMMYAVQPGVCDESFGIHVAELANFPRMVVEMARMRVAELESKPILPFKDEAEKEATEHFVNSLKPKMAEGRRFGPADFENAPPVFKDLLAKCSR